MRRRSSPEKNSDRVENSEGNHNLHNEDRGDNEDSIEPLREALDDLRVGDGIDRVDGVVDETESSSASSLRSEGESSSSSRQRHSSIQRVEHLHRFIPPNVSADSAPIVNVLPGPVVSFRETKTDVTVMEMVKDWEKLSSDVERESPLIFLFYLSSSFRCLEPCLKDSKFLLCPTIIA